MSKKIFCNWKMNGSKELVEIYSNLKYTYNLVVFAPFVFLSLFKKNTLGVQNFFNEKNAAVTGEISLEMLKEFNISYSLVGHSERRYIIKESQKLIKYKIKTLLKNNITPVLCVGEKLEHKQNNLTKDELSKQLKAYKKNTIIAYEPVWSIGSGLIPSSKEIESVISFIKEQTKCRDVLYGGSVNAKNAKEILSIKNLDGLLIGGASLKPEEISQILEINNDI